MSPRSRSDSLAPICPIPMHTRSASKRIDRSINKRRTSLRSVYGVVVCNGTAVLARESHSSLRNHEVAVASPHDSPDREMLVSRPDQKVSGLGSYFLVRTTVDSNRCIAVSGAALANQLQGFTQIVSFPEFENPLVDVTKKCLIPPQFTLLPSGRKRFTAPSR